MGRRGYLGSAKPTTLTSPMTAGATSAVASDLSTWAGIATNGPFSVTINRGESNQETILVGAINTGTNTLSSITRNYADSTGVAHNPGETVEHTTSKVDADEANAHVNSAQHPFLNLANAFTAANSFGAGSAGAAQAFIEVGDDGGGDALIQAGHGTLADAAIKVVGKGTGSVFVQLGGNTILEVNPTNGLRIGSNAGVSFPSNGAALMAVQSVTSAPTGTPSGGGWLWVESGALKYKGSSGTVTTLGAA